MMLDELTKARTRNEYLQMYYADNATGYHPECEPVSEAAEMLPGLLEHIDSQASQIATLKATLIQERKDKMQLDASRFGMGIPEETAMDRAKEQLAREMPWINWEGLQPVISDLVVIRSELEETEASDISPQDCCP
jgi:hypothetical protein